MDYCWLPLPPATSIVHIMFHGTACTSAQPSGPMDQDNQRPLGLHRQAPGVGGRCLHGSAPHDLEQHGQGGAAGAHGWVQGDGAHGHCSGSCGGGWMMDTDRTGEKTSEIARTLVAYSRGECTTQQLAKVIGRPKFRTIGDFKRWVETAHAAGRLLQGP